MKEHSFCSFNINQKHKIMYISHINLKSITRIGNNSKTRRKYPHGRVLSCAPVLILGSGHPWLFCVGMQHTEQFTVVFCPDRNICIKQFMCRLLLMHQVFIQQIRRTVTLFKCLLIKHKAQAVRLKKLHVGFVQVIGDDFDLPLASFFLDRPAYAFLPVGGYIDPCDVGVLT